MPRTSAVHQVREVCGAWTGRGPDGTSRRVCGKCALSSRRPAWQCVQNLLICNKALFCDQQTQPLLEINKADVYARWRNHRPCAVGQHPASGLGLGYPAARSRWATGARDSWPFKGSGLAFSGQIRAASQNISRGSSAFDRVKREGQNERGSNF